MMEVVESSHLAFFFIFLPIVFLSLSLFLSPFSASWLLSSSLAVFPWPRPSACGPRVALASDLRRGARGVTMGLRGAEVGGRRPQRRRRALHMLVPLWRVHLCQSRNDRRLEGRLAADGNGLALRRSREEVLRGRGGRLAGGPEAPRAAVTHKEQP